MSALLFLVLVLAMVLIFTYTNGFHDAANAIAQYTRALGGNDDTSLVSVCSFTGR